MHLTGNELSAASSVVAALAIIGGYLGVRSANHNALTIAREERSAKQNDELDKLKRTAYVSLLSALNDLVTINLQAAKIIDQKPGNPYAKIQVTRKRIEASTTVANCMAETHLITDNTTIVQLIDKAYKGAISSHVDATDYIREATKLRAAMQCDLRGEQASAEALDQMARQALGETASEGDSHAQNSRTVSL